MPLELQPPNFAALAAMAANGAGSLNLSVPGNLGLQGLQLSQQQREANQRNLLGQMQLRQQGDIALGQQRNQRNELAQQGQYQQGLLAQQAAQLQQQQAAQQQSGLLGQGNLDVARQQLAQQGQLGQAGLDVEKQKLFQIQQAKEIEKLLGEKKEKLEEKGAYAAYVRLALEKAKTPEEAQQIRIDSLKEAVKKGYYTKEEADIASRGPLSQFKSLTEMEAFKNGKAAELKALMEMNKDKTKSGTNLTISPDGTVEYSSTPTTANVTKAQGDVTARELAEGQFKILEDNYNPEYFTDRNQFGAWLAKHAERKKGIPLAEQTLDFLSSTVLSSKSPEEKAEFLKNRKSYFNTVDQLFNAYKKEITGQSQGIKELEAIKQSFINGEMSPSEFVGGLQQVRDKFKTEANYNKKLLQQGVNATVTDKPLSEMTKEELEEALAAVEKQ